MKKLLCNIVLLLCLILTGCAGEIEGPNTLYNCSKIGTEDSITFFTDDITDITVNPITQFTTMIITTTDGYRVIIDSNSIKEYKCREIYVNESESVGENGKIQ